MRQFHCTGELRLTRHQILDATKITLKVDGESVLLALREIVGIVDAPPQLRDRIAKLGESFSEFASPEFHYLTTDGTRQAIVVFKPSECLLDLVSAARAWKSENLL